MYELNEKEVHSRKINKETKQIFKKIGQQLSQKEGSKYKTLYDRQNLMLFTA